MASSSAAGGLCPSPSRPQPQPLNRAWRAAGAPQIPLAAESWCVNPSAGVGSWGSAGSGRGLSASRLRGPAARLCGRGRTGPRAARVAEAVPARRRRGPMPPPLEGPLPRGSCPRHGEAWEGTACGPSERVGPLWGVYGTALGGKSDSAQSPGGKRLPGAPPSGVEGDQCCRPVSGSGHRGCVRDSA